MTCSTVSVCSQLAGSLLACVRHNTHINARRRPKRAVAQEAAGSDDVTALDAVLAVDPEGVALDKQIEALEAALREIVYTEPEDKYWPGRIARKALEGKDD